MRVKIFPYKDVEHSGDAFVLKENDLFGGLSGGKGSSLLLGKYTLAEVKAVLKKRNFYREAEKRGFGPLLLTLAPDEIPSVQRLQIFHRTEEPDHLIVDLKFRESVFKPREHAMDLPLKGEFRLLILEWLTLQNPLKTVSDGRMLLPGQENHGLGIGRKVFELFVYLARISGDKGILAYPAFFHNALLFSHWFRFLKPEKEAEILAIRKTFSDVPFRKLAWIVYLNCLYEQGKSYEWKAEEMLCPISRDLKRYFESAAYKNRLKEEAKGRNFRIDWSCYERKKP